MGYITLRMRNRQSESRKEIGIYQIFTERRW